MSLHEYNNFVAIGLRQALCQMMDVMSRSAVLRRNEQVKAVSSLMGNAGLALVAAALGRWFLGGLDEYVMLWLLAGGGLIWTGVTALTMLEAEG
jgi:hypothetical protein